MSYVIAEAGTNHANKDEHERFYLAQRLIFAAAKAGADAVKFQLFVPDEELFCPFDGDEKRWPRWRNTFLPLPLWKKLKAWADTTDIDLIFSAFQKTGVEWSADIKGKYYKVASRAAASYPYEMIPGPAIISLGMEPPPSRYAILTLDCVAQYPAPLTRWSGRNAGLSDHSGTIWPGLDAINRGAKFLEVHFRIDGCNAGPDLPVCLSIDQLKLLCDARDAFRTMNEAA